MQDFTIMFVVGSFAAANKNSAVLMLSSNSAWSPRWDNSPIVRQDTHKKSLYLRKTSVRKTPLRKFDYRNKCFHIHIVWRPGFSEVVESYHVIGLNSLDALGDFSLNQESRREGWTDARSAVCFCLGSGLFGSYNSD